MANEPGATVSHARASVSCEINRLHRVHSSRRWFAVASPGFGTRRRGTKRHRNNVSHTLKIAQNRGAGKLMHCVAKKIPIYPLFIFLNKMETKLILPTVMRKILKT